VPTLKIDLFGDFAFISDKKLQSSPHNFFVLPHVSCKIPDPLIRWGAAAQYF